MRLKIAALIGVLFMSQTANAGREDFHPGPAIPEYGRIADVENEFPIAEGTVFQVTFDIADRADAGEINRSIESAARFINMHVAAGVPEENIHLALVIHGGAVKDVVLDNLYTEETGEVNANTALVATLLEHGVRIYVCGQSATYQDVRNDDLLPGVTMALSAMTAHAQLQQEGYTLNPF